MKRFLSVLSNIVLYLPNIIVSAFSLLVFLSSAIESFSYSASNFGRWNNPRGASVDVFSGILGLVLLVCIIAGLRSGRLSRKVRLAWASFALSMVLLLLTIVMVLSSHGFEGIVRHDRFNDQILAALMISGTCFAATLLCVLIAKGMRHIARKGAGGTNRIPASE